MDLTKFLGQDTQEPSAQRLSKEEYAAQKKQEREEIWGMIDGKAQEIFQNGDSLKGFLDFMGQCKPQRTDNLFLLYAQNPEMSEVMVFADDAAKVNRVMDKMNLDFVRSEVGEAVHEVTAGMEAPETEAVQETVQMPEGEVQFEISDLDEAFQVGDMDFSEEEKNQNHPEKEFSEPENFIPVQEEGEENLSGSSLHSRNISTGQEKGTDAGQREQERPSVRRELENIKREKAEESQKRSREKNRGPRKTQKKARKKRKVKAR